jgi:hypothetical protein
MVMNIDTVFPQQQKNVSLGERDQQTNQVVVRKKVLQGLVVEM